MNYELNSYAVVEDRHGIAVVPGYTRSTWPTVLLDGTTAPRAAAYLCAYVEARKSGHLHNEADQRGRMAAQGVEA